LNLEKLSKEKIASKKSPFSKTDYAKTIQKKGKEGFVKRFLKKRLVKKIERKIKKATKKAQRDGILSDSRIYLGLLLLLGGVLVSLLLASWLQWIGALATLAGLILIIWGLLDMLA